MSALFQNLVGILQGMSSTTTEKAHAAAQLEATIQDMVKHEVGATQGAAVPATFLHAAAEDTRLPDSSADLVSICLVCHELPRSATKEVTFA